MAKDSTSMSELSLENTPIDDVMRKRLIVDGETDINTEVQLLTDKLKKAEEQIQTLMSAVSKGYIAGKKYDDPGSGSDTQCLPSDPTWNKYNTTPSRFRGKIYGSEIDISSTSHIFDKDVHDEDLPCVLCRTPFPTTVMFPARKDCYPGWTLQYSGYLTTNLAYPGRGSYESICLDVDPEFIPHSQSSDDQHVLYLIDVECGSLPCPPYIQGAELACAVCSK